MKIELPEIDVEIIEGSIKIKEGEVFFDEIVSVKIGERIFVVNGQPTNPVGRPPSRLFKIRKWLDENQIEKFAWPMLVKRFPEFSHNKSEIVSVLNKMISNDEIVQMKNKDGEGWYGVKKDTKMGGS